MEVVQVNYKLQSVSRLTKRGEGGGLRVPIASSYAGGGCYVYNIIEKLIGENWIESEGVVSRYTCLRKEIIYGKCICQYNPIKSPGEVAVEINFFAFRRKEGIVHIIRLFLFPQFNQYSRSLTPTLGTRWNLTPFSVGNYIGHSKKKVLSQNLSRELC